MQMDGSAKKTNRLPGVLRVLLFLLIFAVLFFLINKVMYSKNHREYFLASANEAPGTVDMAMIGSSHVYHALYSMQLFQDYGIASVNQGISAQRLELTYATAREVIERHHPKMLVMDIYMARKFGMTATGNAHKTVDNMQNLPLKIDTVTELYPTDLWMEFLFPFSVYHNRWEELAEEDFSGLNLLSKGSKEEITHKFRGNKDKLLDDFKMAKQSATKKPDEKTIGYLEKIRDLCAENDVELVFIVVPYFAKKDEQKIYNWIGEWCGKNGIGFCNFLYMMDEIGFDLETGMRDEGHLNYFGGTVVTDALGKFLTENYDLPDRRGDPKYASWEDNLPAYNAYLDAEFEKLAGN